MEVMKLIIIFVLKVHAKEVKEQQFKNVKHGQKNMPMEISAAYLQDTERSNGLME